MNREQAAARPGKEAPAIGIEGLCVRYGDVIAVQDVTLEVRAGEIFGFLGPNGAGKTSTIRVLLDLLRPSAGVVCILGQDVRAGGGALRAQVGYLPGDLALFPKLTGREVLRLFSSLQRRPPVDRDAVLDKLGFHREALDRRVRTYSTGMRQMIGIAAAFQHAPRLLVLDEPTAGLDPLVREAFLDLVRAVPTRGATVFLSSHVLAEVEACAHRVGLIDRGELRLVDSIESLRRTRPRQVTLRYADGREEHSRHEGPAEDLLRGIDPRGLVDLEVRAASLEDVMRSVVTREDAS